MNDDGERERFERNRGESVDASSFLFFSECLRDTLVLVCVKTNLNPSGPSFDLFESALRTYHTHGRYGKFQPRGDQRTRVRRT